MIKKLIPNDLKSQITAVKTKYKLYGTWVLFIFMITLGYMGWNAYEGGGLGWRAYNIAVSTDFFDSPTMNAETNSSGRKIKNFMYDCDFYHFSDFALSHSSSLDNQVPSYCYSYNPAIHNTIFLWGDSHAQMLHYGLIKNLPANTQLLQVSRAACRPRINIKDDPLCDQTNQFALTQIKKIHPEVVILAQRDTWSKEIYEQLSNKLLQLGVKKILFIGKSPEWKSSLPKIVLRKFYLNTPKRSFALLDMDNYRADYETKEMLIKNRGAASFVSLNDFFCNKEGCLVYIGDNPREGLTTLDGHHLSPSASDIFAKEHLIPLIFSVSKN